MESYDYIIKSNEEPRQNNKFTVILTIFKQISKLSKHRSN